MVFAVPTQILLRRDPQKYSLKHLSVYIGVAIVGTFIFSSIFLFDFSSITISTFFELLLMSIYNATVYWLLDSIIVLDD